MWICWCNRTNDIDLNSAQDRIKHRGPDMQNQETGKNWKVAFNRLSINDLSENGMQPFSYENITVYMNGEIFNFIELIEEEEKDFQPKSHSDVEIIPFLFKKYGAFIELDSSKQSLRNALKVIVL